MKSLLLATVLIASAGVTITGAYAQIGGSISQDSHAADSHSFGAPTMHHIWFPGCPALLAADRADVQKELRLDADQQAKIAAIEKQNGKTWMDSPDKDWALVSKVLSPAQRKRVLEIAFQSCGPIAAMVPGLKELLEITPKQAVRLGEIEHGYLLGEDKDLMESQTGDAAPTPDQAKAARSLRLEVMVKAVTSVLTPAQMRRLTTLGGQLFVFDNPAPRAVSVWIRAMGMGGE